MYMRRLLTIVISFILIAALVSCKSESPNPTHTNSSELTESPEETRIIELTNEMTDLDHGFSAVRHDGEDGFDQFISKGGASSDKEVLRFLTENLLHKADDLYMQGMPFGCSTISVKNADNGWYFGRNFDWNTCDALVIASYPVEDYASISTVNLDFVRQGAGSAAGFLSDELLSVAALYAPLDGINEKGLCVSVNMIQDSSTISQDNGRPDLTTTTAIRMLLNKAATVEEALSMLEQYDLHASMNYMVHFAIADSEGNAVAVEYIDNEMVVTETPVLTNFYLAEGSKQGIGTKQSHTRFDILTQALENNPSMTAQQVRDTLSSVSKGNFGEFESTEWSVVFDQSALTAVYYHRENYGESYAFAIQEQSGDDTDMIQIIVGETTFSASLYDNETAQALAAMLPITLDMSELNGNEKYCYLNENLPRAASIPDGIRTGDLMLFGSDCLVLFYKDFPTTYSYTPLGRIDDPEGLAEALGNGSIRVSFQ